MKAIIPEEHHNQIFDNLIEEAVNKFIAEGDVSTNLTKSACLHGIKREI